MYADRGINPTSTVSNSGPNWLLPVNTSLSTPGGPGLSGAAPIATSSVLSDSLALATEKEEMDLCIFFCEIQVRFLILDPGALLPRGSCLPLSSTPCHSAQPETLTFGGAAVRAMRTPHGPGQAAWLGQVGSAHMLCVQLGWLQRFCSYFMRLSGKKKKGDAGISEESVHVQASCKMGTKNGIH